MSGWGISTQEGNSILKMEVRIFQKASELVHNQGTRNSFMNYKDILRERAALRKDKKNRPILAGFENTMSNIVSIRKCLARKDGSTS